MNPADGGEGDDYVRGFFHFPDDGQLLREINRCEFIRLPAGKAGSFFLQGGV